MVYVSVPTVPWSLTVEPTWTWVLDVFSSMMTAFLIERGHALDAALDERLLVLGVLVLGVLGDVAVLLGLLDPGGDLRAAHVDELVELGAQLLETLARDVLGLVVHGAYPSSRMHPGASFPGIHE